MAKTKSSAGGAISETIKTIVYALLIAGVIRTLLFQPFWIPSGSMKDTLLIGDFLFVNKFAYGYSHHSCPFSLCPKTEDRIFGSEPERGDVVVFKHPSNGQDYIKRLIGLPGDTIQMRNGRLYINGELAEQTPDGIFSEIKDLQGPMKNIPRCANEPVALGEECQKARYRETLPGGVEHSVLDIARTHADNTDPVTVPEGHYFFMGDNRDNSIDSRFSTAVGGVDMVPDENLIGRADRVIVSSAGRWIIAFWAWRSDRFFKAIE